MSSPIHSFLFSPPSSPHHTAADTVEIMTNHGLTSLKSLFIPTDRIPRASLDGSGRRTLRSPALGSAGLESNLKARSPRTPQNKFSFADAQTFPSAYAKPHGLAIQVDDMDATPRPVESTTPNYTPVTPRRKGSASQVKIATPPYLASNIPSTSMPMPSSLPRPLLRLLVLLTLLGSSIFVLARVPTARLPSLRAAATSRKLALSPDGRAYYDLDQPTTNWVDAMDRNYVPPKVRPAHMMKRAFAEPRAPAKAPPTAIRPAKPRVLPASHELLALQSYVLDSGYNVLPSDLDPSQPLDANKVLGVGYSTLGEPGSNKEKAWLTELEKERDEDVVIWYGGNGLKQQPHAILDVLRAMHQSNRHPTLIACHNRPDLSLLHGIFDRLDIPLRHTPLVMIGNKPILGGVETLEDLRGSGKLAEMLQEIGWMSKPESDETAKQLVEEEILNEGEGLDEEDEEYFK